MKILSPKVHGYLDYAVVLLLFAAPSLFNFEGTPAILSYVLGSMQLLMSLMTAYPLGAARVIPFPIHGGVEVAVTVLLIAAPWLFQFAHMENARNFFLVSGVGLGLVWLVTDYRAAESDAQVRSSRRMTA